MQERYMLIVLITASLILSACQKEPQAPNQLSRVKPKAKADHVNLGAPTEKTPPENPSTRGQKVPNGGASQIDAASTAISKSQLGKTADSESGATEAPMESSSKDATQISSDAAGGEKEQFSPEQLDLALRILKDRRVVTQGMLNALRSEIHWLNPELRSFAVVGEGTVASRSWTSGNRDSSNSFHRFEDMRTGSWYRHTSWVRVQGIQDPPTSVSLEQVQEAFGTPLKVGADAVSETVSVRDSSGFSSYARNYTLRRTYRILWYGPVGVGQEDKVDWEGMRPFGVYGIRDWPRDKVSMLHLKPAAFPFLAGSEVLDLDQFPAEAPRLLKEGDESQRVATLAVLRVCNQRTGDAWAHVLKSLDDTSAKVRSGAVTTIRAIGGKEDVQLAVGRLQDGDATVRSSVVSMIGERCADDPGSLAALRNAIQREKDDNVLNRSFEVLVYHKVPELGPFALEILNDPNRRAEDRQQAARYLGAVRYQVGFDQLVAFATDSDLTVNYALRNGAVEALGTYGGQQAADTLLEVLRNPALASFHRQAAEQVIRTRVSAAIRKLEQVAAGGNRPTLDVLVQAGLPESFDAFAQMTRTEKRNDWLDQIVCGLKNCGGEKAIPVYLHLLTETGPRPADYPLAHSVLVDQFIALNAPQAIPELSRLARQGNHQALQILCSFDRQSAFEVVSEIASRATGAELEIALDGLANKWPEKGVNQFKKALNSTEPRIVQIAIRGMERSNSGALIASLLPLLQRQDDQIVRQVNQCLSEKPPGSHAAEYVQIILSNDQSERVWGLVSSLIENNWSDPTAVKPLGKKLRIATGDMRFQIIQLLRHLSGKTMGPEGYHEYQKDAEGWTQRWVDWSAK